MTLIEFYELVNNDNKDYNTLYVAVSVRCNDGVVFFEPTDPRNWTYRFVKFFDYKTIQTITSTPKDEGYSMSVTVWLNTGFNCVFIANRCKPTPYNAPTVMLNCDDIHDD